MMQSLACLIEFLMFCNLSYYLRTASGNFHDAVPGCFKLVVNRCTLIDYMYTCNIPRDEPNSLLQAGSPLLSDGFMLINFQVN